MLGGELRAGGVLWLPPPHSLWSPRGPALCLRICQREGTGRPGLGRVGLPWVPQDRRTDGPTGRKRPELSPGECVPEDRVTQSPQGSVPGRMGPGVSVPLDRWTHGHVLKGPGWRKPVTHPAMRPQPRPRFLSRPPGSVPLRNHRPPILPHPSRPGLSPEGGPGPSAAVPEVYTASPGATWARSGLSVASVS